MFTCLEEPFPELLVRHSSTHRAHSHSHREGGSGGPGPDERGPSLNTRPGGLGYVVLSEETRRELEKSSNDEELQSREQKAQSRAQSREHRAQSTELLNTQSNRPAAHLHDMM
ncbi:hypothetical protein EYF80_028685 [Liparis tanakae]|uniref:Uncharacterized protein n=1 Tax=Liparis tanakae TaxID=230148 RepID=A0A4Z2H5M1_9TELE|nr:hypothetical protein EYF80_028685 [Liparis tanakae]